MTLVVMSLSGCVVFGDSFEAWEPGSDQYLAALGDRELARFADESHALAYALSVDCFANAEVETDLDQAVRAACSTEFGLLSDIMTMSDVCERASLDGNRNVERVNGGELCG